MRSLQEILDYSQPVAIALGSIVVNKYEANECHFPVSLAFSANISPGVEGSPLIHAFLHVDQEVYKDHPLYDQFLRVLDAEKESNPELRFYFNSMSYCSLEDIQDSFKELISDVWFGGHYYFRYVLPLLKKYKFLDSLSPEQMRLVDDYAFDTVSLYLFDRFYGLGSSNPEFMSSTCKDLFNHFEELNATSGSNIFKGTKLTDIYLDLFGEVPDFLSASSTCIHRSDAIIRIFCGLLRRMGTPA